jgi:hypothetical protein
VAGELLVAGRPVAGDLALRPRIPSWPGPDPAISVSTIAKGSKKDSTADVRR